MTYQVFTKEADKKGAISRCRNCRNLLQAGEPIQVLSLRDTILHVSQKLDFCNGTCLRSFAQDLSDALLQVAPEPSR